MASKALVVTTGLRAYYTQTGQAAHLALYSGARTICGTGLTQGDALYSDQVTMNDQEGRVSLCRTCRQMARAGQTRRQK